MLFNSYVFLGVFLPAVLAGFYVLGRQAWRLVFVVVASYVFYAYGALWFPALMLGSTTVSFVGGRLLAAERDPRRRQLILATAIAGTLSLLLYFKYAQFIAGNTSSFVSVITGRGLPSLKAFTQGIALPVGISFYTFEAISYLVDVYRGTIPVERNPLKYAFFISFFPHLVAGPIVRYGKLEPQLRRVYRLDPDLFVSGLVLFSLGLAKKVLIAPDCVADRCVARLAGPARAVRVVGRNARLLVSDLFRLRGVQRHGARARADVRHRAAVELRPAVSGAEPARVLASLACDALDVAAGLPLRPARREPQGRPAA